MQLPLALLSSACCLLVSLVTTTDVMLQNKVEIMTRFELRFTCGTR
jgi:hypothetical protein